LQRFCLRGNKWKAVGPAGVFYRPGYTQHIANGATDDSLEKTFKTLEDTLPTVLTALDRAANGGNTKLDEDAYAKLFSYCAHLWCMSPFAKAAATINFLVQLDSDLKVGWTELLKLIGIQEQEFPTVVKLHSEGAKFVLSGGNYLQTMFRVHFNQKCAEEFMAFRHFIKWTLYHSPLEIPVPDVAFMKFHDKALNAHVHVLPISPKLVLIGNAECGVRMNRHTDTTIRIDSLTASHAEYIVETICLSGITAIACQTRTHDILNLRDRAFKRGTRFAKIKNLDEIFTAGIKELKGPLMLVPTTLDNYRAFVNSFIEQAPIEAGVSSSPPPTPPRNPQSL
jgi:hypothetical protein